MSENLQTITYFDREDGDKLIQFSLDHKSDEKKFYINIHDGKNYTNIELNKDELMIVLNGIGRALSL